MKVWKFGDKTVEEWARDICNRVWKGEGWPEVWKEREIVPVIKKGKGKMVEEYRGVILMPTLYRLR